MRKILTLAQVTTNLRVKICSAIPEIKANTKIVVNTPKPESESSAFGSLFSRKTNHRSVMTITCEKVVPNGRVPLIVGARARDVRSRKSERADIVDLEFQPNAFLI